LRLTKLFRHEGVALIHTNSLKSDILGGLAGRLAGIPVIWHVRDRIEPDYLPKNVVRVFRLLAAIIPKHIVANSAATFATLHLRQKQKHFTVYSGIIPLSRPLRVVHDGTNVQDGEKESDRPVDSAPVIGLVGRITRWKGQHIFIQAAAQVLKRFPTAQFQIIGSALFDEYEYEREVRQLANELGIARAVRFLGFRPDVQELITKLQILVHASILGEPFGQVIVEGMAAGKPVVATNGGGVPEIVIDGVTGFLVPMGDATAMAAAIGRLLENPKMMNEMGTAGQRRAESHFSIDQTVRKIEQIYQYFGSHV
jgi:glycosyltransferase involved in cell wall biosynthesis